MPKPIAVALYAVLDTCLVIDSGANNTVVSPLVNLEVIASAVKSVPIGGMHLSRLLFDCIRTKGIDAWVIFVFVYVIPGQAVRHPSPSVPGNKLPSLQVTSTPFSLSLLSFLSPFPTLSPVKKKSN